jgi:hypothetical protein
MNSFFGSTGDAFGAFVVELRARLSCGRVWFQILRPSPEDPRFGIEVLWYPVVDYTVSYFVQGDELLRSIESIGFQISEEMNATWRAETLRRTIKSKP